jgi:hypothetical protein
MASVEYEDVVTASDFITLQNLEEVEAAISQTRGCTFASNMVDDRPPPSIPVVIEGIMQPIYSCKTCAAICGSPVGVCEPCSLRCHADHELQEVGIRRTFRCDCPTHRSSVQCSSGGPVPPTAPCASNRYGPNFEGRFCSCLRPYDKARDEMFQCVACDDWLHDVHIPGHLPSSFDFEGGMVCSSCVRSKPYLRALCTFTPGLCGTANLPNSGAANSVSAVSADELPPQIPDASDVATPLQPWVACLTCTDGADDGRGVCMSCAEKCHAGHIMTKPRVTQFSCDCIDLLLNKNIPVGSTRASCLCVPSALPPVAPQWCAANILSVEVPTPSTAASIVTVHGDVVEPVANLHSSVPLSSRCFVDGASIFLSSDDDLLSALCRCDACMACYVSDGVATWFMQPDEAPVDLSAQLLTGLDASTLRRVPGLIDTVRQQLAGGESSSGARQSGASSEDYRENPAAEAAAGALADAIDVLRRSGFQTTYEAGMQALTTMPALDQVQALHNYGSLEAELMPFLRTFAEAGRVVTAADIQGFFANLSSGRRVRSRLG